MYGNNIKIYFLINIILLLNGCTIQHQVLNKSLKNRMFNESDQYYETEKYLISKKTIKGSDGKQYHIYLDKEKLKKLEEEQ